MYDEQGQLDQELARLAHSLRTGDSMKACYQLADFARMLDRAIVREERALSSMCGTRTPVTPDALARVRGEHENLRRLVALVARALDRADDRQSLEAIGNLRSVLLLHLAKEEDLRPPRPPPTPGLA